MIKRGLILLIGLMVLTVVAAQSSGLTVGGRARVYVEDPTGLRMRSGAGVNYDLIENLFTGDIVDVIGGPQSANGYVWWNIRAASGNTGWSVEAADGLQTLIPLPPLTEAEPLLTIEFESDALANLRWSPDNTMIAFSTVFGGQLHVFDTETGDLLLEYDGTYTEAFDWSADSQYIKIENSFEDISQIIIIPTGEEIDPDDEDITFTWVTSDNTRLRISDFSTGDNIRELVIEQESGTLTGGATAMYGRMELGDATGGINWELGSPLALIWSMAHYQEDGTAEVWNLETGELLLRVPHSAINSGISASVTYPPALSTDGARLATIITLEGFTSEIIIWETGFEGTIGEKSA